jgi:hypothetical protein
MNTIQPFPITELLQALEPMIRQIVREELNNTTQHSTLFLLYHQNLHFTWICKIYCNVK